MTNDCICSNVPRIWRLAGVTRTVRLTVTKDGSPYDFTGLQTVLRIDRDNSDFHYEPQFTVEGDDNNIIVFTWAADKQPLGDYTIEVTVTDGSGNKDRVNWHGATGVRLVEYSNLVKGEDAAGVESDSELGLDGIFTMNGVGMDAYEEWLADGNEGSLHDYILWMQGPAREAAEVAEAQMAVIQSRADDDHTTAESDHTRAGSDHTTATGDHTRAEEDHQFAFENRVLAYEDHLRAEDDHTTAAADHTTAQADHATAGSDHTRAESDHSTAASDHTTAASDHTKAGQDSTRAGSDHDIAVADHAQAEADHTRAEGDHTTAAADHTTAAADHTQAASDHTTAAADHTQAVADHAVMAGYDTRLTNVETDVTQLGQEVDGLTTGASYENPSVTETSGSFIGVSGVVSPSSGFAYTSKFFAKAGTKIVVHARGYLTYVSMIARVITEGESYKSLVISIDSDVHDYEYIVEYDGYYAASFSTAQPRTITLQENTPELITRRVNNLTGRVEKLDIQGGNINLFQGGISSSTGNVAPSSLIVYSEHINVSGIRIDVNNDFYIRGIYYYGVDGSFVGTNPVIPANLTTYTDNKIGTDNIASFVLTFNRKDGENTLPTDEVVKSVLQRISDGISDVQENVSAQTGQISILEKKTSGSNSDDLTLSETAGKFISNGGTIGTSNNFAYTEKFYVEKGKEIIVHARGYQTSVAMISKVVTEDSLYTPLVVSIDSNVRDYSYIVMESGYYAASFSTAQPRTITIAENTPFLLDKRITDNSNRIAVLEMSNPSITDGLYGGIPVVGMIGDSLMSGAGYDPNTGAVHDNIDFAWWRTLERKSGMTYRRFCQGGMSTFTFVTDSTYGLPAALTAGKECNLYIVGLEINDRNNYPDSLGTSADIDLNDPDNNTNTFYGNYGKIIQKITVFNPGCKFILFTNPRSDGDWNDAIREIAGMFTNCYLVDLYAMYNQYFAGSDAFFNRYKDSSAHYPAMAYSAMAKLLEAAINKCINDNYTDFREIQYQG